MSLKKIVVIATTKSQPTVINSEATTWGQLQDSLSSFGDVSKLRAVVKESKTTLELPDALLPEEDFTLFLSSRQIKAGSIDITSVLQSLSNKQQASIAELISEIEGGDHDSCYDESSTPTPVASTRISDEDKDMLEQLKRMQ